MFKVYILISKKNNKYYIGYTENLEQRLLSHNSGAVRSTRRDVPWEVFHTEDFATKVEAIRRERQPKNWKSRKAIERLKFGNKIEDPRSRLIVGIGTN